MASNNKIEKALPKLPMALGILTPTLGAYFHFFGYSYLKAKLEVIGFDYVSIDLSFVEGIYIAIKGFLPAVMGILNADQAGQLLELMAIALLISIIFPLVVYCLGKVVSYRDEKKDFRFILFFRKKVESFVGTLSLIPIAFTALSGVYVFMYFTIVSILLLGYAIAALGMAAGQAKGYTLIETPVCKPAPEIKNAITGCRKVVLADETKIKGVRLYKNNESTYFLTNDAAYELDKDNKVKLVIPIHRSEDE